MSVATAVSYNEGAELDALYSDATAIRIAQDNGHNGSLAREFVRRGLQCVGFSDLTQLDAADAGNKGYNAAVLIEGTNGNGDATVTFHRPWWNSYDTQKEKRFLHDPKTTALVPNYDFIVTGLNIAAEAALESGDDIDMPMELCERPAAFGEVNQKRVVDRLRTYGLHLNPLGLRPNRMVLIVRGYGIERDAEEFAGLRVYPIKEFFGVGHKIQNIGTEYPRLAAAYLKPCSHPEKIIDTKEQTEGFLRVTDKSAILEIVDSGKSITDLMREDPTVVALWPAILDTELVLISHQNGPYESQKRELRKKYNDGFESSRRSLTDDPQYSIHSQDNLQNSLGNEWEALNQYIREAESI